MSRSSSISIRIAASLAALSLGLFTAACEKDGASTTPPDAGDAEVGEEPAEEEAEEEAGGW